MYRQTYENRTPRTKDTTRKREDPNKLAEEDRVQESQYVSQSVNFFGDVQLEDAKVEPPNQEEIFFRKASRRKLDGTSARFLNLRQIAEAAKDVKSIQTWEHMQKGEMGTF